MPAHRSCKLYLRCLSCKGRLTDPTDIHRHQQRHAQCPVPPPTPPAPLSQESITKRACILCESEYSDTAEHYPLLFQYSSQSSQPPNENHLRCHRCITRRKCTGCHKRKLLSEFDLTRQGNTKSACTRCTLNQLKRRREKIEAAKGISSPHKL